MIGEGWTGICTAKEIADFGFEVVLVEDNATLGQDPEFWIPSYLMDRQELKNEYEGINKHELIEYLPERKLNGCTGTVGKFSVQLKGEKDTLDRTVGAIVLAHESRAVPLLESYGLKDAQNAVSLFQLEMMLESYDSRGQGEGLLQNANQIAILYGFDQEGDILGQRRVMESVAKLEENGCDVYVYTRNLKVADKDLEELYKDNRNMGGIFFKLQEKPEILSDNSISHYDPVLLRELNLKPDILVVEEELKPSPSSERLIDILGLTNPGDKFLQENNIHRLPVSTNRTGIYTVGTIRDIMSFSNIKADAANVAVRLNSCFEHVNKQYATTKAFVDKDKCCYCLTCYRSCPHGAIRLEDKPVISSFDCQVCGICASECPQEAITIVDVKWEEIKSAVSGVLKKSDKEYSPKIIAYCCENSAYEAGLAAKMFDRALPAGLEIIKVPCAGSMNLDLILSGLKEGADGILLLGCHPEACKSSKGNTFAYWRTWRLRKILEEVGFSGERIHFETLAENMDFEFSKYAMEMEEALKNLGPNPLMQPVSTSTT